jgi:hypothetical protein
MDDPYHRQRGKKNRGHPIWHNQPAIWLSLATSPTPHEVSDLPAATCGRPVVDEAHLRWSIIGRCSAEMKRVPRQREPPFPPNPDRAPQRSDIDTCVPASIERFASAPRQCGDLRSRHAAERYPQNVLRPVTPHPHHNDDRKQHHRPCRRAVESPSKNTPHGRNHNTRLMRTPNDKRPATKDH